MKSVESSSFIVLAVNDAKNQNDLVLLLKKSVEIAFGGDSD
ncbi:hypothetical protein [Shouchella miscanthi]|uniref:Uncharacterized protein n=1 Tax=Shouchella miscanthi TaxID=2598861 RepID=A0ABU6NLE4_9BACI|nr:hypothetical protein [Shouchella miscanthi]